MCSSTAGVAEWTVVGEDIPVRLSVGRWRLAWRFALSMSRPGSRMWRSSCCLAVEETRHGVPVRLPLPPFVNLRRRFCAFGRVAFMTDSPLSAIGRNVRAARSRLGWSLDTLAMHTHASKAVLVALEQGRSNPNLRTLIRVSDALGLPLARLLDTASPASLQVIPMEPATVVWHGDQGGQGILLAGVAASSSTQLLRWYMKPGEVHAVNAEPSGTVELVYVLDGELTLTVNEETVTIVSGETARLFADRKRGFANDSHEPLTFIRVLLLQDS